MDIDKIADDIFDAAICTRTVDHVFYKEKKQHQIRILRDIAENYQLNRNQIKILKNIALDIVMTARTEKASMTLLRIIHRGNW